MAESDRRYMRLERCKSRLAMEKEYKDILLKDIDEQVEILNQSILNGWQGIYPLKREENKRGQNGIAIDESKDDLDDLF